MPCSQVITQLAKLNARQFSKILCTLPSLVLVITLWDLCIMRKLRRTDVSITRPEWLLLIIGGDDVRLQEVKC